MAEGIRTIIYPEDIAQAKRLYRALLGVQPSMDQPYYAGFSVGGQDIGLDLQGHGKGITGPVGYVHVEDIGKSLKELLAAGASRHQAIKNAGGGRLVASVNDADGNVIGLIQAA